MSMTREETRIELQTMKDTFEEYEPGGSRCQMALKVALTALRPVSREQVEKVWRGEWVIGEPDVLGVPIHCSRCGWGSDHADPRKWMDYGGHIFCGRCGVPMTDEAVEMVTERMNKLYD